MARVGAPGDGPRGTGREGRVVHMGRHHRRRRVNWAAAQQAVKFLLSAAAEVVRIIDAYRNCR
jgi:hypothetical protein